ncbi:hypothetical protein FHG87_006320 [Trinorchestia longiramus]|nr:hypothetical protein FHG87_006320 [Trinorchestia longiramus]
MSGFSCRSLEAWNQLFDIAEHLSLTKSRSLHSYRDLIAVRRSRMKTILLAVVAACLAVPSHTVDVKVVGDESSGIFTKIISDAPAAVSDSATYSSDDNVEPTLYDAQGRSRSIRRNQQGSYLEQPNRYQTGNRFSAGSQNSIRTQGGQKTQAGIKYDNFGRPIQTLGSQVNRPSNIYQNRVTAGQSGSLTTDQFGQFSQGNRVGTRPTSTFNQNRGNTVGLGSTSGRLTNIAPVGQHIKQQFGVARPTIGQQLPNQFANSQTANRPGQLKQSGVSSISPTASQFGQQFGKPSTSQFGQFGQQSASQFGQFGQQSAGQFGQQSLLNPARPLDQRRVPHGQQAISQFSQFPVSQFGQQNSNKFGQQSGGQFGQQSGSQFGQQSGNKFGQQSGGQFGQQSGSQFGQLSGNKFGQQSGNQFGLQSGSQFGQLSGNQFGQQSGSQFGQQSGSQFGQLGSNKFGQQSGSQFGQQSGNQFGQQSTSQFGQQSGSQFGPQASGQFGQVNSQFGQKNSIPFGQQQSTQFGQQSFNPAGQGFTSQQPGFQQGVRTVGNQFNRVNSQQPNRIINNPLRGNEIDTQRTTGFIELEEYPELANPEVGACWFPNPPLVPNSDCPNPPPAPDSAPNPPPAPDSAPNPPPAPDSAPNPPPAPDSALNPDPVADGPPNPVEDQFGQFSQGNRVGTRPTSTFNQNRGNTVGLGSTSGRLTNIAPVGQHNKQQFGVARPTIGQQFPNQFANSQTANRPGQLKQSGVSSISQTTSQFGQQFGKPSTSQFGQFGQQSASQFGQFGQQSAGQFGQQSPLNPARPLDQRRVPHGQQAISQFSQIPVSQFGQQSSNKFGQQSGGQFGQQSGSQFGQLSGNKFGQQSGNQFGLQSGSQFGQLSGNQFGQQSGSQFGQQSGSQFGQLGSNKFGQQSGSQFGQLSANKFGQQSGSQFGQQRGSQFGPQASGQFGQVNSQFGQKNSAPFGQQQSTQFGQQSFNPAGQGFTSQQPGFQQGVRTVGNQFNRVNSQQPNRIITNPLRGNEIDTQRTTGFIG